MSKKIDLKDLMKAGIHFGHKPSVCHPKMKPFLFGIKNNVNVIDLEKSFEKLEQAGDFAQKIASSGGTVLFVGTKPQARGVVEESAKKCGMPYVTERWLGGTLTNYSEIFGLVKKLERLLTQARRDDYEQKYTKKERLVFSQEVTKLQKNIGGISGMSKLPQAVFITSVREEKTALSEAAKKNIPMIGVCDSNANPDLVDLVIPANDDAIKSIALVVSYITERVEQGRAEYEEGMKQVASNQAAQTSTPKEQVEKKEA